MIETKQDAVIKMLLKRNAPMTLREITFNSPFTYHQVFSVLSALKMKGLVRKVKAGIYEATDEAKINQMSPDAQIKMLKRKVEFLEQELKRALDFAVRNLV